VDLYGSASRELEAGGCQRSAIASLIEVLGATEPLGLAGGDQPAPSFLLGRAYLGCNDLGSAERYLDAAQEAGEVPQAKLQSAREDLRLARQAVETKRQILATVSDYLALRALVDLGSCNREATSALESSLSASALPGEPMQPHLLLAKAYRLCGDRDGVRRHLDPARREASPESAEIASYEAWLAQPPGAGVSSLYAHSYALVVGVASYKDPSWSDLRSVTAEVEGVVRVLKAHQFEVQPLLSPTKAQLERAMADFFEKKRGRGANNRLVFYFAGHGWTELNRRTPLGYIVPADTPSVPDAVWDEVSVARAPGAADVAARPVSPDTNFNYMQYLISMDVFRTYAREARASHVIFIFDSCFSGTVFDATGSQMEVSSRGSSLLEQVLEQPVRVFITAGEAHESVPGKSFFEPAIEKGLEGDADLDGDGVILGTEVGRYAARHGSSARNTPRWGLFDDPNYARGDIAFKNLRGASGDGSSSAKGEMSPLVAGTLAEIDYWKGVLDAPGVASISGYLATYPAGVFGTVASRMLERQDELNLPK
jgi:hypothetical protein